MVRNLGGRRGEEGNRDRDQVVVRGELKRGGSDNGKQ